MGPAAGCGSLQHEACVHSQRTAQVCGLYTVGVFLKVLHVTLFLGDYSGKRTMGRKKKSVSGRGNRDWLLPIFSGEICSGAAAGNDCSAWSIWNRLQTNKREASAHGAARQ